MLIQVPIVFLKIHRKDLMHLAERLGDFTPRCQDFYDLQQKEEDLSEHIHSSVDASAHHHLHLNRLGAYLCTQEVVIGLGMALLSLQ